MMQFLASLDSGTGVFDSCRTLLRPHHDLTPQAELRGYCSPTGAQDLDTNEPHYLSRPMSNMTGYISHAGMALHPARKPCTKEGARAGRFCAAALPYAPRPRPYHADSFCPSSVGPLPPPCLHAHIRSTLLLTRHAPFFIHAPLAIGSTADAMNA